MISGMDGTFKRTRGESFRGFYNAVLSHKIFVGMDSLYKEMNGDLYFVSDSYNFMNFNAEELVDEYKLKPKEIISREPFAHDSEFSYKYSMVKKIIESSKDDFVLVGNDKGVDQEVFAKIKEEFPSRVDEVYIHVVENNKDILRDVVPYHTAFDIAVNEYSKGRMPYGKVAKIGEEIFSEEKFHKVFPLNAHCPRESKELNTKKLKEFDHLISDITKKTLDFCNG